LAIYIAEKDLRFQIISDSANTTLLLLTLFGTLGLSISEAEVAKFGLTWLISLCVFLFLYLLAIVTKGAIGGGDIKFAPSLSASLAWFSPAAGFWFLLVGFQLAAVVAIYKLTFKGASLKQRIAFGPYLTLGYLLTAGWILAL
jgi:leader peptidase (prepilin peptidase)/N-methyltransferase